ncbi:hypothetical protein Dxin01_01214 [Deinococcus xinjiangensis]|uniref:PrcB C-terminal domain-containing protein n=1 Tax=Deinococcus xinjiangensis TaxID=457454 RepID=A0ABP9V888_9DEIO
MRRSVLAFSGVTALLLSACSGNGPSNLKVHEVALYGGSQERITWVYGDLNGSSKSSVKIGGVAVDLRPQVSDPLATAGSLSINGKATYRVPTDTLPQKLSLTRDSSGLFNAMPMNGASIAAIYYTDGAAWYKLGGTTGSVRGQSSAGLRGAGQLTDAEADAVAAVLQPQGPLAVAVLNDPSPALTVEPQPSEILRTSLYILPNVLTTASGTTGTVTTTPNTGVPNPNTGGPLTGTTGNGSTGNAGSGLSFTSLAQGSNAAATSPTVQVATTGAQAAALYTLAYGRQTNPPRPPALSGNTLVGVFIGQRNSGGYSVQVSRVAASGSNLNLTVNITAPPAGSLNTMALTSPWVIISVPGRYTSASVTNMPALPGQTK